MTDLTHDRASRNEHAVPRIHPWLIILAAILTSTVIGRLVADGRIKYGFAIVLAACYAPLVLFNLAAALAVWTAIQFFRDLSFLSSAPNAIGVLVALGWIGAYLGRRTPLDVLRGNRRLLLVVTLFGLWLTLSIAWAGHPGAAATQAGYWWLSALTFLIAVTTFRSSREIDYVLLAFVAGSLVSVLIGLATGSLKSSDNSISQTAIQGRFTGGGGDPNVQAVGFVATMFLIIGLLSVHRQRLARRALTVSFALVTVGFLATQSRGGLLALGVSAIAALIISPRHRSRILGLGGVVVVAAVVLLLSQPAALARITNLGGGSSGRDDLWTVAWHVFTGHPLIGVGEGNFQVIEAHYVLRPGSISRIGYLTDVPHLVHNSYLQLLAESGIIGLAGYLTVVFLCLRAAWRAVRRFEEIGRPDYADLARAVLMGMVAMLVAIFFISDGEDLRLWLLLALGPALHGLARRTAREGTA